jgi:4-methyl-5(b-hydroxyethyl)-thiazole monophosphate biosynthesis
MASVLVPLASGCEELEAVTIIDLLRRAGVEVVSAGLTDGPVKASRGVVLVPDATLDQALQRDYDMIVLPGGGPGSEALAKDARVLAALQRMARAGKYTAAICAAPKALAQAGLLQGRRTTSYPGSLDGLAIAGMTYLEDAVVQDGKVITSRGPGTAMDFALHLIEVLLGKAKRGEVEEGLVRC